MDGKWVRQKPNFVLLNIFMISVFGGLASIPRDRGAMNASALSKASKLSREADEDDEKKEDQEWGGH